MYLSGFTLLVLFGIYLPCCLLALFIAAKIQSRLGVRRPIIGFTLAALALAALLAPTWEGILGKHYLDRYCDQDGGLYVNGSVPVDSLYFYDRSLNKEDALAILAGGFSFIEHEKPGVINRFWMQNAQLMSLEVDASSSKFVLEDVHNKVNLSPRYLNIFEAGLLLRNRHTGEIIAGFRDYYLANDIDDALSFVGGAGNTACSTAARFAGRSRYDKSHFRDLIARPTSKQGVLR